MQSQENIKITESLISYVGSALNKHFWISYRYQAFYL